MESFIHSLHPTVRMLIAGRVFRDEKKVYIITDDIQERKNWLQYGTILFGREVHGITSFPEFFAMLEKERGVFLIPIELLTGKSTLSFEEKKSFFTIKRGDTLGIDSMIERLLAFGYRYSPHGEPGSYRREGDIIRVFDAIADRECVIEYFDTEIESILLFEGGKRVFHERVNIYRNHREDTISSETIFLDLVWNQQFVARLHDGAIMFLGCDFVTGERNIDNKQSVLFPFFPDEGGEILHVESVKVSNLVDLGKLLEEKQTIKTFIFTKYGKALSGFLDDNGLNRPSLTLHHARVSCQSWVGVIDGEEMLFLGDDIFSKLFLRYKTRKVRAKDLDLLLSIKPGDYVVHRDHGVGQFRTLLSKNLGGVEREYMEIAYALNDRLFLPLTELHRISKYIGAEMPELTKLSGKEWERTLEKTDEEVERIAEELLSISARRRLAEGVAFPQYPEEEKKFLEAFPYNHTPDQLSAIRDIFTDMEKGIPMDRLLAGDVGFGKTEVAMNASYKAVLAGAQVAVISPLLVLAEEHSETFIERMAPFGVRVAVLTRMQSPGEARTILSGLKNGKIDIVIGTHRLLSDDIHFRRLGLLIIDEEHRFGVEHKERFKKLKSHIDVLMLSATPIPRSLNLALSGLKTISMLTTAPYMRKSIRTIVTAWNESTILQAIHYELSRGGQVIVLHNRIRSIEHLHDEIEEMFRISGRTPPHIIVTHGKLSPEVIEDRIHDFKKGEYDILLSTTIIENGVNFLRANTILITDPEDFGLAQLHQLRGRVGRKDMEGVCYLLYREHMITREGRDRMMTLASHSELGAGFEIAMRDMEIRGVGDVLGFRQAGKSKDVGVSLYFQMLEEKVEELRSGKKMGDHETKIELDISTSVSPDLFDSDIDKLSFYRDIEAIDTLADLEAVESVFLSRDGDSHHRGLENLFLVMRARIILREYGIVRLSQIGENYIIDFDRTTPVEKIRSFLERFDGAKRMILLSPYKVRLERKWWKSAEEMLEGMVGK